MFILVYSEGNTNSIDNGLSSFNTHAEAYEAMSTHLESIANKDDYTIENRLNTAPGHYDLYGNWCDEGGGKMYLGFTNDYDAYLLDGDHKWAIFEVPGAYFPQDACDSIKTCATC